MNLSLIDLADSDPRSESPGVTRTPTPSSANYWDTRGMTAAQVETVSGSEKEVKR